MVLFTDSRVATLREGYSYIWMSKSNQLVLMIREDPKMVSTIKASIEDEFKRSYGKPFDWHVLLKNSNIRFPYLGSNSPES